MSDLRTLVDDLLAQPLVPQRPLTDVAAAARRIRARRARKRTAVRFVVGVGVMVLALDTLVGDSIDRRLRTVGPVDLPAPTTTAPVAPFHDDDEGHEHSVPPAHGTGSPVPAVGPSTTAAGRPPAPAAVVNPCTGTEERTASDVGITRDVVRLRVAATFAGRYRGLAGDALYGVRAAADRVNRAGGVCGRYVDVDVAADPFGPGVENAFAVVAGPLHPDVNRALLDGTIDRLGIPVMGTDGLTAEQYTSPWLWPAGTSAAALARITTHHAYTRLEARSFAVVYDSSHGFGTEAAEAASAYVAGLRSATMRASVALDPDDTDYRDEAAAFEGACGNGRCDNVLLALAPANIIRWLEAKPAMARRETAALPLALTKQFPNECVDRVGAACRDISVWTPFRPPTDVSDSRDMREYRFDMTSAGAHASDALLQSSYVGTRVLLDALARVGPNPTRAQLKAVLDGTTYRSGLVDVLTWSPGQRRANRSARELRMELDDGKFVRWWEVGEGWERDPLP